MLKRKAAACVTAAARSTAEPVQMQAQAAEAIEAASSLEVAGDARSRPCSIADDLPQRAAMLLRQWQTVNDSERQIDEVSGTHGRGGACRARGGGPPERRCGLQAVRNRSTEQSARRHEVCRVLAAALPTLEAAPRRDAAAWQTVHTNDGFASLAAYGCVQGWRFTVVPSAERSDVVETSRS